MGKMNPVVHFEMPATDSKRMSKFYSEAFGWKSTFLGPDMGEYVVVKTTECDERGFPNEPGKINGGFFQKDPEKPQQGPSIVISVDDLKASIKKVADAHGKVLGEPMEIPGVGIFVSFHDTEGNLVSMIQPLPM